jgi:hypothetical protein
MNNLLHKVNPAVIEKTREKEGECAFFAAFNPVVASMIEQRLAELQPNEGTAETRDFSYMNFDPCRTVSSNSDCDWEGIERTPI